MCRTDMPSPKKFGLFFKKNAMEALNSTGLLFFLKQTLIFTQRNLASVIAYSIFWSDSMLACTTYISAVYSFWLEFTTRTMFRGHIFISFHITCLFCVFWLLTIGYEHTIYLVRQNFPSIQKIVRSQTFSLWKVNIQVHICSFFF